MKYIIVDQSGGMELPVVFAEPISHFEEAGGRKVVSAGFCEPSKGRWHVSGRSESLNVNSRPGDGDIIAMGLNLTVPR